MDRLKFFLLNTIILFHFRSRQQIYYEIIIYQKLLGLVPVELITILVDVIEQHLLCSALCAGAFASELVTLGENIEKNISTLTSDYSKRFF